MNLPVGEAINSFKFYEEAADKNKAQAWSLTTWVLTLNGGVLAFAITFYVEHPANPIFPWIEVLSALVGLALCYFLIDMIQQLGKHVQHYWTSSNRIAAATPALTSFIDPRDVERAREETYRAPFPRFCRRLQVLAILFLLAHSGWAILVLTSLTQEK
jgi:hypothetical protein